MKLAAFLIVSATLPAGAALTLLDSASFANQYDPAAILSGTNTGTAPWSVAGISAPQTITLNTGATPDSVDFNQASASNGWIQQDTGNATPFEVMTGSWTMEVRAFVGNATTGAARTATNGFALWADLLGNNQIITIDEDRVALYGTNNTGTVLVSGTDMNTDGFHTYRLAYEHNATTPTNSVYHVFRDGVDLTGGTGVARRAGVATTRLIVGDCCSGAGAVNTMDIDVQYVRFTPGAFAPIPEPSGAVLTGAAALGLLRRRRR